MLINSNKPPFSSDFGGISALQPKVDETRTIIHGDLDSVGYSLEFYDYFTGASALKWSDSFHDQGMEICLNLQGNAEIRTGTQTFRLGKHECALYTVAGDRPSAIRHPGEQHCYYTLKFSRDWLLTFLRDSMVGIKSPIRNFLQEPDRMNVHVEAMPMPLSLLPVCNHFLQPPVSESGQDLWYCAKVFEILSHTICKLPRPLSASEQRNKERVERARAIIEERLSTPPSLEMIAEEVGCSMFHLSRTFKQMVGLNISDYQRAASMKAAATYLSRGKSVSETACAVGYRSTSAFINVFQKHHHMTPASWASVARGKKPTQR